MQRKGEQTRTAAAEQRGSERGKATSHDQEEQGSRQEDVVPGAEGMTVDPVTGLPSKSQ